MTNAIAAFGTLLKMGDGGSPESFTTIAEVREIGGPELTVDTVDVTSHDSTGGWEEHIPTILRSGEISLNINYVPTGGTHDASTGLLTKYENKTSTNWQLVFSDSGSTTWSFAAFVTGFSPSAPHDDRLSADVTLKLTGQPTLA